MDEEIHTSYERSSFYCFASERTYKLRQSTSCVFQKCNLHCILFKLSKTRSWIYCRLETMIKGLQVTYEEKN